MAINNHILLDSPPISLKNDTDLSVRIKRENMTKTELMCAEILASLEYTSAWNFQRTSSYQNSNINWINRKITKKEKTHRFPNNNTLAPFKRNINACFEHRRKHQKCPVDCPRRLEKEAKKAMELKELASSSSSNSIPPIYQQNSIPPIPPIVQQMSTNNIISNQPLEINNSQEKKTKDEERPWYQMRFPNVTNHIGKHTTPVPTFLFATLR